MENCHCFTCDTCHVSKILILIYANQAPSAPEGPTGSEVGKLQFSQRMRLSYFFGAMHYLQTTFRNNEKTAYGIIGGRQEKFNIMSVALASAARYFERNQF